MECQEHGDTNGFSQGSLPNTPDMMAPLSRELESVIAKRNLLTCRTRRKVLEDLRGAAAEEEVFICKNVWLIPIFLGIPKKITPPYWIKFSDHLLK